MIAASEGKHDWSITGVPEHRLSAVRDALESEFVSIRDFENVRRERDGKELLSDEYPRRTIDETEDGFEFYCENFRYMDMEHLQNAIDVIVRPDIEMRSFDYYVDKYSSRSNEVMALFIAYSGTMRDNVRARIHRTIHGNKKYQELWTSIMKARGNDLYIDEPYGETIVKKRGENELLYIVTFTDIANPEIVKSLNADLNRLIHSLE